MHSKYEVSMAYSSKVKAKVKVDNRQTDKQTDRTKKICPQSFNPGALKTHEKGIFMTSLMNMANF